MQKIGLILEGGGMRGAYTAGVLDFFMDKNIEFNACYGVSAGSVHACSYISKQRGRAFHVGVDYLDDREYASAYNLIKTGNFFGTEMCYDRIPNELNPYDYKEFDNYKGDFYAVVTNCLTGQAEYLKITDLKTQIDYIRASCSLPLMAEMVTIGGVPYLDGGISDSIPVRRSVKDGNIKNVVVLTRDINYRKKQNELLTVIKIKYSKYPNLVEAMINRHKVYNMTIDYIKKQEEKGNVFVIRPSSRVKIGRLEKDKKKLSELYKQGYKDASKKYEDLVSFMENKE